MFCPCKPLRHTIIIFVGRLKIKQSFIRMNIYMMILRVISIRQKILLNLKTFLVPSSLFNWEGCFSYTPDGEVLRLWAWDHQKLCSSGYTHINIGVGTTRLVTDNSHHSAVLQPGSSDDPAHHFHHRTPPPQAGVYSPHHFFPYHRHNYTVTCHMSEPILVS